MKRLKKLLNKIKYKIKQKELNSKNIYYDEKSGNYYTFNVTYDEKEIEKRVKNNEKNISNNTIYKKKRIMTQCEQEFFKRLYSHLKEKYYIAFQVPLSSIVEKISTDKYQNELYRTIDYALIDKSTYETILLIELNDMSHLEERRIERDKKVKEICDNAGIKIIAFWTNTYYTDEEILSKIKSYIKCKIEPDKPR